MKKLLPVLLFWGAAYLVAAQDTGLRYEDYIYKPNIKTVQFHLDGLPVSYPIIDLNSNSVLKLSFDDLDGDAKNYTYRIIHCDINWQPSNLAEMEYIEGFMEDRIEDFRFSFKTLKSYTHYEFFLPNRSMTWTKSGNYLLKIYEDERQKALAITRRFVVVEPIVRITPKMMRPNQVGKIRTHQEIDFVVDHQRLNIRAPLQEIRAVVLQNGRWDNAIGDLAPLFARGEQMIFDFQDRVIFPGGKEFRFIDFRTLRARNQQIASIERFDDTYEVVLHKDQKRSNQTYLQSRDVNGKFVIETFDQQDSDITANYADVFFSLYCPEPYYDHELYVFGAMSDWQLKPEFKMAYNPAINGYVVKVPLKQGFYDYAYARVPINAKRKVADLSEIEGDWHETENLYTILLYYNPFGERYHRVIGAVTFSSNM
ncbi:MAG TPA: DUF5103 domain-containing protein [Saprospiraceae bacterium]|nr:DUF5103 domain-containing protein [Saprospiraceae bacterium]HMP13905.1 DUF5103 domain-containing protein [Saprospiraceae bacterium]